MAGTEQFGGQNQPRPITRQESSAIHLQLAQGFTPLCFRFKEVLDGINARGIMVPPTLNGQDPRKEILFPLQLSEQTFLHDERSREYVVPYTKRYVSEESGTSRTKIPIGEYGQEWAMAILMAARTMYTHAIEHMPEEAAKLHKASPDLIGDHTYRGNPLESLLDGIETIAVIAAHLTYEKVEGFDNPLDLLERLNKDKLFVRAAFEIPFGITIPMTTEGYRFKHPLQNNGGNLSFSAEIKELMKMEREAVRNEPLTNLVLRRGCPVGRENIRDDEQRITYSASGIQVLADIFAQYTQFFYKSASQSEEAAA